MDLPRRMTLPTDALAKYDPLLRAVGLVDMLMVKWDSHICDAALDEIEKVIDTDWIIRNAVATVHPLQMGIQFLLWR